MKTEGYGHMSGFADSEKPLEMQGISSSGLAESCARQRATRPDAAAAPKDDLLGEPLTISEVARVFGCSVWTVRHAYLPQGLPHFRSGPSGKLVFFHKQVVQWILQQQEKGGI